MFKDSKSLKEHKKSVQENKKTCKCDLCNNIFSFQTSLKRHVKTIHEEKRPEKKPSKVYVDSENKPNYSNYVKKDISFKTIYLTCNERENKYNDCPGYAHIDRITNQMSVKKDHSHSPREEKIAKKF